MRAALLASVLTLVIPAAAAADVTIVMKTTMGGPGMGEPQSAPGRMYIRGNRMRTDVESRGRTQTTILDIDAGRLYTFDSESKEAEVWKMPVLSEALSNEIDAETIKAAVTPNGQSRSIGAQKADGYDLSVTVTAPLAGDAETLMTASLTGPIWIVKQVPGADEYSRFYRTAAEKGWIFSRPTAALAQPGPARAMTEMYRRVAETGGILYESQVEIRLGGSGPAELLSHVGVLNMSTAVEDVSTKTLDDALFAPPAGYVLREKN